MRTLLLAALVLFACSLTWPQAREARSYNYTVTGVWDSAYVLTTWGPAEWDITNVSTTDTLIYFFGRTKADSLTSAKYRLYPGYSKHIVIPFAGANWTACFRKSSGAALLSNLEQLPAK